MKDYLTLGSTPAEEKCTQVGEENYHQKARKEGRAYINQLKRIFGEPPNDDVYLTIKGFPHDFGTYHEVCVVFDDQNKESIKWAYDLERNLPSNWDDEAQEELKTY